MSQPLAKEQRTAALHAEIQKYTRQGYRVLTQTDTTAQLIRPKRFSFLVFIVLLILMVLPAILYVVWFAVKRDEAVYLSVDEYGKVKHS